MFQAELLNTQLQYQMELANKHEVEFEHFRADLGYDLPEQSLIEG